MEFDNSHKKATDSTWVSKIVMYSFWQSSCSWRVRFALNLKGLFYEYRAVNLDKGEQFTSEEKYHQRPLLPVEPQLRALNLQRYMEESVGPEEKQLWAKFHIQKGFRALEKLLSGSTGKYATGKEVYMADVFLAPQIAVATKRFNIDMSEFPHVKKDI